MKSSKRKANRSLTSGLIRRVGRARGLAAQLQARLVEVIAVQVGIAQGMHEIAGTVTAHLGHHQGQQRIGGDVEGHAQEDVGAALVELAGQPAVGHIELEQGVAGRQGHASTSPGIPGGDDVPARVGIVLQPVDQLDDLVDLALRPDGCQWRHWWP